MSAGGRDETRDLATPLFSAPAQPAGSHQQVMSPTLGQGYGTVTQQPSPPLGRDGVQIPQGSTPALEHGQSGGVGFEPIMAAKRNFGGVEPAGVANLDLSAPQTSTTVEGGIQGTLISVPPLISVPDGGPGPRPIVSTHQATLDDANVATDLGGDAVLGGIRLPGECVGAIWLVSQNESARRVSISTDLVDTFPEVSLHTRWCAGRFFGGECMDPGRANGGVYAVPDVAKDEQLMGEFKVQVETCEWDCGTQILDPKVQQSSTMWFRLDADDECNPTRCQLDDSAWDSSVYDLDWTRLPHSPLGRDGPAVVPGPLQCRPGRFSLDGLGGLCVFGPREVKPTANKPGGGRSTAAPNSAPAASPREGGIPNSPLRAGARLANYQCLTASFLFRLLLWLLLFGMLHVNVPSLHVGMFHAPTVAAAGAPAPYSGCWVEEEQCDRWCGFSGVVQQPPVQEESHQLLAEPVLVTTSCFAAVANGLVAAALWGVLGLGLFRFAEASAVGLRDQPVCAEVMLLVFLQVLGAARLAGLAGAQVQGAQVQGPNPAAELAGLLGAASATQFASSVPVGNGLRGPLTWLTVRLTAAEDSLVIAACWSVFGLFRAAESDAVGLRDQLAPALLTLLVLFRIQGASGQLDFLEEEEGEVHQVEPSAALLFMLLLGFVGIGFIAVWEFAKWCPRHHSLCRTHSAAKHRKLQRLRDRAAQAIEAELSVRRQPEDGAPT